MSQSFRQFVIQNITPLACVFIAGFLAFFDIGGWGWFLFVALFINS